MNKNALIVFAILMVLFSLQALGGYYQIKNLQNTLRKMRGKGTIGMGQKKGWLFNGNLVILACDSDGNITAAEALDGSTFLSRFHPIESVWDLRLVGTNISSFLEIIKGFDEKKRKKYRGYVNAIEALDMRLFPEHYTQEELDAVVASQMKHRYYKRIKNNGSTRVGGLSPKGSIARVASYINPDTED